jgi:hypothetical protein
MSTLKSGTITLGLRAEQRVADYSDSADAPFPSAKDQLLGGNLLVVARGRKRYYATRPRLQGRGL